MSSYTKSVSFEKDEMSITTGVGDQVNFTMTPITFGNQYLVTSTDITFDGALRSDSSYEDTIDIRLMVLCNGTWRSLARSQVPVPGYDKRSKITFPIPISSSTLQTELAQYGITNIGVQQRGSTIFRVYPSENVAVFTYEDSPTPVGPTLTNPGAPVVTQSGNYYHFEWTPAIGTGGTGPVYYNILETHEAEAILEQDITACNATVPLFYPAEVAEGEQGIKVVVRARYSGEETYSDVTVWDPQHVLYCYTGKEWRQCTIHYYTGKEFIPCKINYCNNADPDPEHKQQHWWG